MKEKWKETKPQRMLERSKCREMINELISQRFKLEEMVQGYYIENNRKTFLTKGLRSQARKMLLEQQIK